MSRCQSEITHLSDQIMDALRPILHNQPTSDVMVALAETFWAAVTATSATPLLSAMRVRAYANALDPGIKAAVQAHHDTKYGSRLGGSTVISVPDQALYTAFGIPFRTLDTGEGHR